MVLRTKTAIIFAVVVFVAAGVSAGLTAWSNGRAVIEAGSRDARAAADLIAMSIAPAMEEGRSAEVQRIISGVGGDSKFLSLRITDLEGRVLRSKKESEIGARISGKNGLWSMGSGSQEQGGTSRWDEPIVSPAAGTVSLFMPLANRSACWECHGREQQILGVLNVVYDLSGTMAAVRTANGAVLGWNLVSIVLAAGAASILFFLTVLRPLGRLNRVVQTVESGAGTIPFPVDGADEIGNLGRAFHSMVAEVGRLREGQRERDTERSRLQAEVESRRALREINSHLEAKIQERETANKAITALSRELRGKNLELESMVERLKKLNEIGRILNTVMEIDDLVKLVVRTATELMGGACGELSVFDGDRARFAVRYRKGYGTERVGGSALEFAEVHQEVRREEGPLIRTADPAGSSGNGGGPAPETPGSIGMSLRIRGMTVGTMVVSRGVDGDGFGEQDRDLLTIFASQAAVAVENAWFHEDLKANYLATVGALVNSLEAGDPHGKGHSERVRALALMIAEDLELDDKAKETLGHAAALHDIGKTGIERMLLRKEGPLSETEYKAIQSHAAIGGDMLAPIDAFQSIRQCIMEHHERYDGSGYPFGIAGEQISLKGRILAAADAFDAMYTDRPHRGAKTLDEIAEELRRVAGAQLDPVVVESLLGLIADDQEGFIDAVGYAGRPVV